MSARREDLIVGLDIGTTKICAIVGSATEDGIDIVGIGTSPSRGLRKGVVINIDSTVESIRKAVSEAELMAGCEIKSVYAGIAGGQDHTVIRGRHAGGQLVRIRIDASGIGITLITGRDNLYALAKHLLRHFHGTDAGLDRNF